MDGSQRGALSGAAQNEHQDLRLCGGQPSVCQGGIGPLLHLNADAVVVSQDLFPVKFCHNVASFHLFEVKLFRCVMFIP